MKLAKGNLFQLPCDALCITTNGFVKANGECVMGKGCAKQLVTYYPQAPRLLGQAIKQNGNVVQCFMHAGVPIIAFPVKPVSAIYDGTNKHLIGTKTSSIKELRSNMAIFIGA